MVIGYTAGRMGRMPVGYNMPQQNTSSTAPVGITGSVNLGGNLSSGSGGLAGVMLLVAAGLAVFYVVTRKVQGTR